VDASMAKLTGESGVGIGSPVAWWIKLLISQFHR
jgi:hypothetical protein